MMTFGIISGTLTREQVESSLAHSAYANDAAFERDVEQNLRSSGFLHAVAAKGELTEPVLFDIIAGNMTFTATGDDASGYVVMTQSTGNDPQHFYVVREGGTYRVVADDHDNETIGNEVLYALAHDNAKLAKAILDWKRDLTHKAAGDDPFAGPLLPRFWTVDSAKPGANSPEAMRMAAIAMLAGSMEEKQYLPEIVAAQAKATGQHQTDLDILLATAALGAEQPEPALAAAQRLLDQEPDSTLALSDIGSAYALQNNAAAWLEFLKPRLAKKPKDRDLLYEESRAYDLARDYANSRLTQQALLDTGKATAGDYNSYAWLGLYDNHVGEAELKAAQQSNMLSKNGSFADLHTLACIYAAAGRTTEARQVLDQAMYAGNESQPNSAVWYALGLIYEDYGAKDAALTAYRKVEAHELDDHTFVDPMSTWLLAQARMKALGGGAGVVTTR
jgi:tetratricopeptide (TPR) repeat protein